MQNPICISTGCLYRLLEDRNEMVKELRKFSLAGIELSFAYPEYLLNFDLDKDNLEYLQSLRFNSIHAPWENITYGKNKISEGILLKISKFYKQIMARTVVFHKEQIEDYDLILNNDFVPSIENDDWRKPGHSIDDIKNILDKNEKFKFVLDFAHALTVSAKDIPEYIKYFKNRLSEIHIAIFNKDLESHDFLHKYDSEEIRKSLQSLKSVSVPLVLEGTVSNWGEIELIGKEIEYIRKC